MRMVFNPSPVFIPMWARGPHACSWHFKETQGNGDSIFTCPCGKTLLVTADAWWCGLCERPLAICRCPLDMGYA